MGRVLEALEIARRERMQKMRAGLVDPGPAAPTNGDSVSSSVSLTPDGQGVDGDADESKPDRSGPPRRRLRPPVHPRVARQVVSLHDNQSPVAEQLRQIQTNLATVLAERESRTVVVSSPISGDGKSMVTANLAVVLADDPEQRAILIDADMRKSDQHRMFGVRADPGLSEYLSERGKLGDVIHETSLPNLDIMPSGRIPAKPTVLLGSARMRELVEQLEARYAWIVIDTPPILPVTDACLVARHAVGMIMVVRMGRTSRALIERAQDSLAEMRVPMLGCILNDYNEQGSDNNYYYKHYAKPETDGDYPS